MRKDRRTESRRGEKVTAESDRKKERDRDKLEDG